MMSAAPALMSALATWWPSRIGESAGPRCWSWSVRDPSTDATIATQREVVTGRQGESPDWDMAVAAERIQECALRLQGRHRRQDR